MVNSCAPAAETKGKRPNSAATAQDARIILSLNGMAVAPEVVRVDAARPALVAIPPARLPKEAAPRRFHARRIAPVRMARERPVVALGPPAAERLPVALDRVAAVGISLFARNELVLRILDLAVPIDAEVLEEGSSAGAG